MYLTLGNIRGQVGRLMRDNGINSSQFDPIVVTKSINFAQEQVAKLTGSSYAESVVSVASGKAPLPTAIVSIVRVFYMDGATMRLLQKTSLDFEDNKNQAWRSATGTPSLWMDFSGNTIRLNRIPPGASSVVIGFIERPTAMAAEADVPDARIPEYFHQHMKYAAAAFLLNQAGSNEDIAKADKFMEQFSALIGAGPSPVASTEVDR